MSNRGITTVTDATGASHGVVLASGEMVIDTTTRQHRAGDGVTPGGLPQVAQFPPNPTTFVQTTYDSLYAGFRGRYYDDTVGRLYPTRGLGLPGSGTPDTTLPDAQGNKLSPWMWGIGMRAVVDRANLTGTATAKARVTNAWAYFKTQYSAAQILSRVYGTNQIIGLSDDPMWVMHGMMAAHKINGDADALNYLMELIPIVHEMFRDTRPSNPIIDYGVSSPGGVPLKRNAIGYFYGPGSTSGVGDISSAAEWMMGPIILYVATLPTQGTLTDAYKAALLQLAKDQWQWAFTYGRFPGSVQAQAGIYAQEISLTPATVGQINNLANTPTTRQGYTSFGNHATLAMGVFSDMLYALTGDPKYLAEFESIATAYPVQTLGFGRLWNGLPCEVNARDPWGDGFWHVDFTQRLLARFPNPSDYSAFKLTVLGTSKVVALQSTSDGIISPNWGPPELGPYPNAYTWEQMCLAGYGGADGGGQASGRQVTTASMSMGPIAAASLLAGSEAMLGSGMAPGGIEMLTGHVASSVLGPQAAKNKWIEEWGGASGYRRNWNPSGYYQEWINEQSGRALFAGGNALYGALTNYGASYLRGTTYIYNGGVSVLTDVYNGSFFMGLFSSLPGIGFAAGQGINSDGNHIDVTTGGSVLVRFQPGTMYNNGVLVNAGDVIPQQDNTPSIGGNANRWRNIYSTNTVIQTSDENEKDWIGSLSDAEYRAGLRMLKEIGTFRWLSGGDRIHVGVRAQQVWKICIDEGLIPSSSLTDSPYAFLTYDTWEASPAVPAVEAVEEVFHWEDRELEDGTKVPVRVVTTEGVSGFPGRPAIPAGERYGVREAELSMWLHAVNDRRLAALEAAHAQ